METTQITGTIRATCPDCKINKCMGHTGDGEWVCESRTSKFCGVVYSDADIQPEEDN